MSSRLAFNFVRVSLIYFLIGAIWMGFGDLLPAPQEELTREFYMWANVHVMVLGWASFALMGILYYFVPKAAEKTLHSERLGSIHFWLTNITVPVGILLMTYASFAIDTLIRAGLSEAEVMGHPSIFPYTSPL